jgi:hypothetical protein
MLTQGSESIYYRTRAKLALFGALAICGTASPVFGQEILAGKFTLTENTRFQNSVLPAGRYKYSIEPLGNIQSLSSIQGVDHLVLVVVRPEITSGPKAAFFAMASRGVRNAEPNGLALVYENNEKVADALYLEKSGLLVDFDGRGAKGKGQVLAQKAVRPESTTKSGGTD